MILFEMIVMLEHKAHVHPHVLAFFVTLTGAKSNHILKVLMALKALK
jgi:hypothetical protein